MGFLQATLRATFGLVALLESARSTPGPGEMWREALQLVLLVSVPMRLVQGRLALTFWASSCVVEVVRCSPGLMTLARRRLGGRRYQEPPCSWRQRCDAWASESGGGETVPVHTPLVELPGSRRLHPADQRKSVAQWLRLVPGHAPPGARRFETVGSTWLA